jgi:Protein of unknown function (DUF3131)
MRALLATALVGTALLAATAVAQDPTPPDATPLDDEALDAVAGPRACPARTPLSEQDLDDGRVAWRYFERNYHPETGLVSSVEGYPSTTLWDLGSSLLATVAAEELGILDTDEFDERAEAALQTLAELPLFRGELPNKAYDARTAVMTDYENRPAPRGIGSSAVDLGRLVSALRVLGCLHPQHAEAVARVLDRWRWCGVLGNGELHGATPGPTGEVQVLQEGRLGYEQYAALGFAALGFDVSGARRYDRFAARTEILGVAVPRDTRDPKAFGAIDPIVTDPWALTAFEYGLDREGAPLARRIFDVQKRRFETTGVATAAGEDHVDRAPWFVYDAIYAAGSAWRTITPSGADAAGLRGLSTKAAFALATLYPDDPYAAVLARAISGARDPERGWYAGIYEQGGLNRSLNANTNGVILEALLYKTLGPLHRACSACGGAGDVWPAAGGASLGDAGRACRPGTREAVLAAATLPPRPAATATPALPPTSAPTAPSVTAGPLAPDIAGAAAAPGERFVRFAGTTLGGYRGADGPIGGGVLTTWIGRGLFLRGGAEWTPDSPSGRVRFLWGLGYDDWRPKTFFAHLHNWGPIHPGDGLAVDGAELSVGYKLPRLCLGSALCAAPIAAATAPLRGGPNVGARMQLTFRESWFLMGGLSWTVPGVWPGPPGTPEWRVVYGFGLWSWRPGSIYLTYHDWGPSYRQGNGVVSLGVNWAF